MRSFKSFSLRLSLRRLSDDINRGIDAMKILYREIISHVVKKKEYLKLK
jgi:hypothetical protein